MDMLLRLVSDRRGAAAAEYAVLLALFGSAIALAALNLGGAIGCSVDRAALTIAETKEIKNYRYGRSDPNGNANGHRKNC